jgi:hypothetical protein
VALDGVPVGATADQPLAITDVAPGKHELVVSKPGYAAAKQQFLVAAGHTVPVSMALVPAVETQEAKPAVQAADLAEPNRPGPAPAVPDARPGSGRDGYRTGFWVTLVAGAVSAGAAVKFGMDITDVNKKLDPYRRFPCMGNQLCNAKGVVSPALTQGEKNLVSTLNDEGNRDQTLQWICIGVASAFGVASGYLLYKGYIDKDEEHPHPEARSGLRIFPTANASTGGIVAEFDF